MPGDNSRTIRSGGGVSVLRVEQSNYGRFHARGCRLDRAVKVENIFLEKIILLRY